MSDREILIEIMKGEKPLKDEFTIYTGDVRTFQFLRTDGKKFMEENSLGGGNLAIALISVTVLGLIAKTYVILADKVCMNSQGDINETDAIQKLLRAKVNNWNYSDKQILEFWKRIRHRLIHVAFPKAKIVPDEASTYIELQNKIITEKQNPFSFDSKDVLWVNCDVLWYWTMEIRKQIITDLENNEYTDEKIKEAIKFIKSK
ncbi:hypothetical protein DOJK_01097 [Patescibacteria group bacterium]|jgi:hypothetical protein|nr:hypothetical protein DOJK_01097 [Patescibacteria group bacterium]